MEDTQSDSTNGPICQQVGDQTDAYAWGALDAEARATVDQHRAECASCDARLLAAERTVFRLDGALPHLAPPPDLRARVLAATASMAGSRGLTSRPAPLAPPQMVPPIRPDQPPAGHLAPTSGRAGRAGRSSRWPSPRRVSPFFAGVATGLAGALCAAAAAWVLIVRPDAAGLLAPAESGLADGERGIRLPIAIPAAPRAAAGRLVELRPQRGDGAARGVLMYDPDTGRGTLLIQEPGSTAGAEYQVTLIRGAQHVTAGTLTVDERGIGTEVLPEPPPLPSPERIEVQPKAGSGATLSGDF